MCRAHEKKIRKGCQDAADRIGNLLLPFWSIAFGPVDPELEKAIEVDEERERDRVRKEERDGDDACIASRGDLAS